MTHSQGAHAADIIDDLMAAERPDAGQRLYVETLVQLVQAYEAAAVPIKAVGGLRILRHLLAENALTASGLARLLGVHASLGSKILKGERSLTVEHMKKLGARFKVDPGPFID